MDFLFQTRRRENGDSQYLTEIQIGHNYNSYEWWATHQKRYPALVKLKNIFAFLPHQQVLKVFSTAGNIISAKLFAITKC